MAHGMKMERLDNIVQRLKRRANLSDEFCEELMDIQDCDFTLNKKSMKFISRSNLQNLVGYIVMIRHEENNTLSCAYTIHKLDAKLGTVKVLNSRTPHYFLWFKIGETLNYGDEEVKIDGSEVEGVLSTYLEYKALEVSKNKGVIPAINYVE